MPNYYHQSSTEAGRAMHVEPSGDHATSSSHDVPIEDLSETLAFISKIGQIVLRARVGSRFKSSQESPSWMHSPALISCGDFWSCGVPINIDVFLNAQRRTLLERWVIAYEPVEQRVEGPSHRSDSTELILLTQSLYSHIRLMPLHGSLNDNSFNHDDLRYCISTADGVSLSPTSGQNLESKSPLFRSKESGRINAGGGFGTPGGLGGQWTEEVTSDDTEGSAGFDLGAKLKVYKFRTASTTYGGRLHLSVVYDSNVASLAPNRKTQDLATSPPSNFTSNALRSSANEAVITAESPRSPSPTGSTEPQNSVPPSPITRCIVGRGGSPFPSPTVQRRLVALSNLKSVSRTLNSGGTESGSLVSEPRTSYGRRNIEMTDDSSSDSGLSSSMGTRSMDDRNVEDSDSNIDDDDSMDTASDDVECRFRSTQPIAIPKSSVDSVSSSPLSTVSFTSTVSSSNYGASPLQLASQHRPLSSSPLSSNSVSPFTLNSTPARPRPVYPSSSGLYPSIQRSPHMNSNLPNAGQSDQSFGRPPPHPRVSIKVSPSAAHSQYQSAEPFGSLVGSYEESILSGRMSALPSKPVHFVVELGAIGTTSASSKLRCPPHIHLAFSAYYYDLAAGSDRELAHVSPYVASIDVATLQGLVASSVEAEEGVRKKWKGGYRVPSKGQIQIIIKNQSRTAVKVFLIPYDFQDMPPSSKTFIRQKCYSVLQNSPKNRLSTSTTASSLNSTKRLRDAIHLQFRSTSSGRILLTRSIRVVFSQRAPDLDDKVQVVNEGPTTPKYTPVDDSRAKRSHRRHKDSDTVDSFMKPEMHSPIRRRTSFGASVMALAGISLADYSVSPVRAPASLMAPPSSTFAPSEQMKNVSASGSSWFFGPSGLGESSTVVRGTRSDVVKELEEGEIDEDYDSSKINEPTREEEVGNPFWRHSLMREGR